MKKVSDFFGCKVFDDRVMKSKLSSKVYRSLRKTIDEGAKLDINVANAVAAAMKKRLLKDSWLVSTQHCGLKVKNRLSLLALKRTSVFSSMIL